MCLGLLQDVQQEGRSIVLSQSATTQALCHETNDGGLEDVLLAPGCAPTVTVVQFEQFKCFTLGQCIANLWVPVALIFKQ